VAAESSRPVSGEAPELLLVFGADPLGTALTASAFEARVREARSVVVFDTFLTRTAEAAELVFPLPNFSEKEGTYVAGNGLAQKLYPALPAMPHVPPLWGTLDEIARAAGDFAFSPGGGHPGPEPPTSRREGGLPAAALSLPPLPEPERWLIVRGTPLTDHRLRLLPETKLLFPEPAVEIHPSEIAVLDLEEGQKARLVSGAAEIFLPVKADPRTPPGQIHLPFDPANHSLAEFVRAAVPRKGWPASYHLTAIQGLSRAKGS
jgi:predicted molibdopterin-dependent oxidoreductase YjgC